MEKNGLITVIWDDEACKMYICRCGLFKTVTLDLNFLITLKSELEKSEVRKRLEKTRSSKNERQTEFFYF